MFNHSVDPSAQQTDWWDFNQTQDGNEQGYTRRLGETVANALAKSGYYTTTRDYQNLGANISSLANIAKLKAAAAGNIGQSNSDTVRQYLRENLKNYLLTGNLGTAAGVSGPGSNVPGTSVGDLYGQVAANASAAQNANDSGMAKNWFSNNGFSLIDALGTVAGLQQGGGLRSSTNEMLANIDARRKSNPGGVFWQDQNGQPFNPWGGSFSSNLPQQTTTGGGTDTRDHSNDVDPDQQTKFGPVVPGGPAAGGEQPVVQPQQPVAHPVVPEIGGPGADAEYPHAPTVPTAPSFPNGALSGQNPSVQFAMRLGDEFVRLFGRQPSQLEIQDWWRRLQERQNDWQWMADDLARTRAASRYQETGIAAPVVADPNNRDAARAYYNWLQPGGDVESWIDNYLRQLAGG